MTEFLLRTTTATSFILVLLIHTTTGDQTPVLDGGRDPLEFGSKYYITTVADGLILGFRSGSRPNQPRCPQFVYRPTGGDDFGLPVRLFPSDFNQTNTVPLSSDITIAFAVGSSLCGSHGVWQLTTDEQSGETFVSTDGEFGYPGPENIRNWFKIEYSSPRRAYHIRYCPGVSHGEDSVMCGYLSVVKHEDNVGWLGLANHPLEVSFLKA